MTKAEIRQKFDEIVAFAEIEKFIDTPVKRYSSGMYVRLAFAVAAHLESEIVVVDEVLAVGDASFQSKCLGKMGRVAHEGRTILFVSHNMQAIQSLCARALQIQAGKVVMAGSAQLVVAHYLSGTTPTKGEAKWPEAQAPGNEEVRLTAVRVYSEDGFTDFAFPSSKDILVELEFQAHTTHPALCVGFDLVNSEGVTLARTYQTDGSPDEWPPVRHGRNLWRCTIPKGLLNSGVYHICPRIGFHAMYWIVKIDPVVRFEVTRDHGVSPLWNVLGRDDRPGMIAPIFRWNSL
jgi:lipopolysaccharide transport system ATP-binding protein